MIEFIGQHWANILFYIFTFSISAICIYIGNSQYSIHRHINKLFISAGLAIPIAVAGVRYYVGRDYANYVGMVERIQAGEPMWPRPIEPLSSLIINFSAAVGGDVMMFSLFSTLTVIFAYYSLKNLSPPGAKYIAISWIMYLFIIFPTTLNAVRSGLAISLVALAFSQLVDPTIKYRLAKFLIYIFIASMFHISALICLPIGLATYFVNITGKSNIKFESTMLGLAVVTALIFPILGVLFANIPLEILNTYARYFHQAGNAFYLPLASLVMLFTMIITILINKNRARNDIKLRTLYTLGLYYVPIMIVVGWLSYYTGTSRLTFFLEIIIITVVVYALKELTAEKIKNIKIKYVFLAFIVTLGIVMLVRNLNWAGAVPYNTVLTEGSINVRQD